VAIGDTFPAPGVLIRSNWWARSGGFFGAICIAISILFVPRLGTATFVAILVTGQMLSSLIFDQFGLFGVNQYPANLPRLLGAGFLVAGVILIRL
jgi:bacterial/archaeal transporter family-2 protein